MPSQSYLAKIHIAKKEIGLTDQEYRDILFMHFDGARSAKDLSDRQALALINKFRAKGWQPKKQITVKSERSGSRKVNDNYRTIKQGPYAKMQRKVLAMWAALGYDVKLLDARCKKQFKVDRIEWLQDYDALHVLITDLQQRCENAGVSTNG